MESIRKKLTIVGDGFCGKTSIIFVFTKDQFLEDYSPTVFDTFVADIVVDGKQVKPFCHHGDVYCYMILLFQWSPLM